MNEEQVATATLRTPRLFFPNRPVQQIEYSAYEWLMFKLSLVIGLCLCVLAWATGGYFTLIWLQSLGATIVTTSLVWWLIPLATTILEVGMVPTRAPFLWCCIIWILVLGFDVYTTSVGMAVFLGGRIIAGYEMTGITLWVVSSSVGLALALAPERAGRALVLELWR